MLQNIVFISFRDYIFLQNEFIPTKQRPHTYIIQCSFYTYFKTYNIGYSYFISQIYQISACPFLPNDECSVTTSGAPVRIKHSNLSPKLLWQIEIQNHCIRLGNILHAYKTEMPLRLMEHSDRNIYINMNQRTRSKTAFILCRRFTILTQMVICNIVNTVIMSIYPHDFTNS